MNTSILLIIIFIIITVLRQIIFKNTNYYDETRAASFFKLILVYHILLRFVVEWIKDRAFKILTYREESSNLVRSRYFKTNAPYN